MPIQRLGADKPVIRRSVGSTANLTPVAGSLSIPTTTDAGIAALVPTSSGSAVSAAVNTAIANAPTLSTNALAYGAKGNGTADDSAALQAAIDATASNGGGTVFLPSGVYLCASTVQLRGGVHLVGEGTGGDMRSYLGAVGVPFAGTVIRLANNVNDDLLRTVNFAALNGTTGNAESAYPHRFGLHDLVLDGNRQNNTSGWCLRIWGAGYVVDNVTIQQGATGGAYSDWQTGGADMESLWSNFRIMDCGSGDGLFHKGPHDSTFVNGVISHPSTSPARTGIGVRLEGSQGGGYWTNVHVWGGWLKQWQLSGGQQLVNCVSDGPGGVTVLSDYTQWIGGAIYSDGQTPGDVGITFGDGTTRTIRNCRFQTAMFNYGTNAMIHRLRANTTPTMNKFEIVCNAGNQSQYTVGESFSTVATGVSGTWTSLVLADASSFPTSGSVYISDGTTVQRVGYTGKSGNTLTGITGGTATFAAGVGTVVWLFSPSANTDFWEVSNPFDTSARGFYQTPLISGIARAFQENITMFNTLLLRSDTATLTTRASSGINTSQITPTNGGVRPGTPVGMGSPLFSGSGAPTGFDPVAVGSVYFRIDTPTTANQRIYICTARTNATTYTWVGIV